MSGNPKELAERTQTSLHNGLERYLRQDLLDLHAKYNLRILAKKSKKQLLKKEISELQTFREEMIARNPDIDIEPLVRAKKAELDENYSWIDGVSDGMDKLLIAEVPKLENWLTAYSKIKPHETAKLIEENGWILKFLEKYHSKTET